MRILMTFALIFTLHAQSSETSQAVAAMNAEQYAKFDVEVSKLERESAKLAADSLRLKVEQDILGQEMAADGIAIRLQLVLRDRRAIERLRDRANDRIKKNKSLSKKLVKLIKRGEELRVKLIKLQARIHPGQAA
jgi:hypothetical protein